MENLWQGTEAANWSPSPCINSGVSPLVHLGNDSGEGTPRLSDQERAALRASALSVEFYLDCNPLGDLEDSVGTGFRWRKKKGPLREDPVEVPSCAAVATRLRSASPAQRERT